MGHKESRERRGCTGPTQLRSCTSYSAERPCLDSARHAQHAYVRSNSRQMVERTEGRQKDALSTGRQQC